MLREYTQGLVHPARSDTQVLIRGCAMLAPGEPGNLRYGQDILLLNERIAAVGDSGTVEYNPQRLTSVIDGRDRIAVPGLINAHTHSLENLLKAISPSLPLELWLIPLFGSADGWSPDFVYLSTMLGAVEMLKTGTTAVLDHLWTNAGVARDYLDAAMRAYRDVGLRAAVAPSIEDQDLVLEIGHDYGITFPEHPFTDRFEAWSSIEEQWEDLEQWFSDWHGAANGRLRCFAGPSGIHWCSPHLLEDCLDLASRYHSGLHLHAVETQLQARVIHKLLGKGGIAYLHEMGILRPGTSLAHAIWLDPGDLELLARTHTTVVHNPVSNLRLGSGRFPLAEALERDVNVALGSDGSASNDNQNMYGVLKLAGLMHNLPGEDYRRWPQPQALLNMATQGGAAALGQGHELGEIAPGYLADLVLLNLENASFLPLRDPYLHLVYCEHGTSVDTVIVHGQAVVEHGIVTVIDEQSLRQEIRKHCGTWWQGASTTSADRDSTHAVLTSLDRLRQLVLKEQA
ncbi:MAG: amidohydrolase [Ktedonobacteraceae bacterium]|nr:amidohydrolase [Ktedonobacteraceae bacterium]